MGGRKHTPNDIHIQGDTAWMVLTNRAGFPVAVTLIDAADVPLIRSWRFRWSAAWHENTQNYRVMGTEWRDGKSHKVYLHRMLICPLPGMDTDHINHNSLDNRRNNLRPATRQENALNYRPGAYECLRGRPAAGRRPRPRADLPRFYVWFDYGRWRGYVQGQDRRHTIGSHLTREAAESRAREVRAQLAA